VTDMWGDTSKIMTSTDLWAGSSWYWRFNYKSNVTVRTPLPTTILRNKLSVVLKPHMAYCCYAKTHGTVILKQEDISLKSL